MDYIRIKENAAIWMINRNWKRLTAKRREFEQSLFEHTMVELDEIIQLLPILKRPQHFNLSEDEEKILIASIIAHDVGKERKEWQDYILGKRGFVSDIDSELTRQVVPSLCNFLEFVGLEGKIIKVIENCINLHMKYERTDSKVIAAILTGTDRWKTLADIVDIVDNFCSAQGVFGALSTIERSFLANHLKIAYHHVNIRGVSTIFLHKAAVDSFVAKGWSPLLFYGGATVYICSAAERMEIPLIEEIKNNLVKSIDEELAREVSNLVVGDPRQDFLPKPELFEHSEVKKYLLIAANKRNRTNFSKKKPESRKVVVEEYFRWKKFLEYVLTSKEINFSKESRDKYFKDQPSLEISDSDLEIYSKRISRAYPEMMVIKFFKNMFSDKKFDLKMVKIGETFDKYFGNNCWELLQSTSTEMPAQDMAKTVDLFWSLPGKKFNLTVHTIEELSDDKRMNLLIDILVKIAIEVYQTTPDPPSRSKLSVEMAEAFMNDLLKPSKEINIGDISRNQLVAYSKSKEFAGKESESGEYICPLCNSPFKKGVKAKADFIDNPQSHTNRGLSHGSFDKVVICNTCKYERFLRQIILEGKPSELIVIFPRMNIGYNSGNILVQKVKELYEMAYNLMVGNSEDPSVQISLSLTQLIARNVISKDLFNITPKDIVDILTYQARDDTRKKQKKQLEKEVREIIGQTVEELSEEWGIELSTWDEAIDALIVGKINDPVAVSIRKEVFRLTPQLHVVCQTPNMILMPIYNPMDKKQSAFRLKTRSNNWESDVNMALRIIFTSLLIGLSLNVTVAIVGNSDEVDFEGGEGVAYVPPVPSVRELIEHDWIPLSQAVEWFEAIGAASLLANDTGYPERSNLFAILSAQSPGHILRRLEEKLADQEGQIRQYHIEYIETIKEVLK